MTINFYLDNKSKKEERTILLYLFESGKRKVIGTGEKINPKYWDKNKQQAKKAYTGHIELNRYLSSVKEKILSEFRTLKSESARVDISEFFKNVTNLFTDNKVLDANEEFYGSYEKFIDTKKVDNSERTIKKYKTLKDLLKEFEEFTGNKLSFEKIDLEFNDKFVKFLIEEKKHTNNTLGKYISTLKTFMTWTFERSLHQNNEYRKFKTPHEKTEVIYLTEDELMRIYNLDLSDNPCLAQVRDVFCFGCFTGQRYSDLANLRFEDLRQDKWFLRAYKTRDPLEIPLTHYAKEILGRYKEMSRPLPIISHQKTNDYIKKIAKLAEINEPLKITRYRGNERIEKILPKSEFLSTHSGRKTFVTLSLEKGMRQEVVREITGHKSEKSFKVYYKIVSKIKEEEMKRAWEKKPQLKIVNL